MPAYIDIIIVIIIIILIVHIYYFVFLSCLYFDCFMLMLHALPANIAIKYAR